MPCLRACLLVLLASCALPVIAAPPVPSDPVQALVVGADEAAEQRYDAGRLRLLVPSARSGGTYALIELHEDAPYRTPAHVHPGLDESFYVLEGTLALEMDGRSLTLPAGSYVHIPRGTVHAQGSADDRPVKLLTRLSPGGFEQFFLDRVELAKTVGREDPGFQDRMMEIVRRYPQWLGPAPTAEE
ncbi:cupin domain-containing protein [Luteimonas sp. SDU82]|uniref:cupin domain-containing protein n=1 Tax=Luteimonas sp. SDU82 TaxID=3422592 RepID=UPI003EBB5974